MSYFEGKPLILRKKKLHIAILALALDLDVIITQLNNNFKIIEKRLKQLEGEE